MSGSLLLRVVEEPRRLPEAHEVAVGRSRGESSRELVAFLGEEDLPVAKVVVPVVGFGPVAEDVDENVEHDDEEGREDAEQEPDVDQFEVGRLG